jgi:hypothetical protein
LTIPLYAYKPRAVVVFEPFVNFGFAALNQTKSKSIIFKNQGSIADAVYVGAGNNFK